MAFKKLPNKTTIPDSIEEMYVDYKSRKIKGPVDHQTDMLRKYIELINQTQATNISLELPTGSGKTLVGLLIAEWRRRKFGEKTLYLCPTRQLVSQVTDQSINCYGIQVNPFIGQIKNYSSELRASYRLNEAVSVATYSALFNSNSFFKDIDTVIFDDAHSSENSIASLWSLEIDRKDQSVLFENVTTILKQKISSTDYLKWNSEFQNASSDIGWVEKLPGPFLEEVKQELFSCISIYLNENTDDSLKYAWAIIKDKLHACCLYYSLDKILIRPLIPPTETLPVFHRIKNRIFMSATLGEGGDLERITGIKKIHRIECPAKWKKRAIGRRLFYFPDLYFGEEKNKLSELLIQEAGRALVITSSDSEADKFKAEVKDSLNGYTFISAKTFESSPDSFFKNPKSVLMFANRYDGVDLADDKCRLLILDNLSKGLNLQDKFILERMAANSNYNDRIRTKITQMIGRCTRSETDYSLVVVTGGELTDFFNNKKYRDLLHPEIQAEVKFGIEQSGVDNLEDFVENFRIFLKQGDEWQNAEDGIASLRDESTTKKIEASEILQKSAELEVELQYKLWNSNYIVSLDLARSIIGELTKSNLAGYKAFWLYLAGNIAYQKTDEEGSKNFSEAIVLYKECSKIQHSIAWLSKLITFVGKDVEDTSLNINLTNQVEKIVLEFQSLGLVHNAKFDKKVNEILDYTINGNSKKFERAQFMLGELLGFVPGKEESDGSPDPWWMVNEKTVIVFEDHSAGSKTGSLGAEKARQASTHERWIKKKLKLDPEIIQVLITPKVLIQKGAIPHLDGLVSVWDLDEYKAWVTNAISVIREAKSIFNPEDLLSRAAMAKFLVDNKLDSESLIKDLKSKIYIEK